MASFRGGSCANAQRQAAANAKNDRSIPASYLRSCDKLNRMPVVRSLRVRPFRVPMAQPHQTASGTVAESPLVLTDVLTDDGVEGHSITFTYTAAALKPVADLMCNLAVLVQGEPLEPAELAQKLARRFRLLGTQ